MHIYIYNISFLIYNVLNYGIENCLHLPQCSDVNALVTPGQAWAAPTNLINKEFYVNLEEMCEDGPRMRLP